MNKKNIFKLMAFSIIATCPYFTLIGCPELGTLISTANKDTTVSGIIKDKYTGMPLAGVTVKIDEKITTTDVNGFYSISGTGYGEFKIFISKPEFETISETISISGKVVKDFTLGTGSSIIGSNPFPSPGFSIFPTPVTTYTPIPTPYPTPYPTPVTSYTPVVTPTPTGITQINKLLMYFPFNRDAIDASGNNYKTTVNNLVLTGDRFTIDSSAYSFNGTNSYIEVQNTADLNLNSGFTIASWVKFDDPNSDLAIVGKHNAGTYNGYFLAVRPGKKFQFYVGSDPALSSDEDYNDGKWHLVVGVYDGKKQYLYIDGILKKSQEKAYTSTNNATVYIGKHHDCCNFKGSIDEVKLYNYPLSSGEINIMFGNYVPQVLPTPTPSPVTSPSVTTVPTSGLLAYYPFNSNTNDMSGKGLNAQVQGATLTTNRFNNSNSAYYFNGTNAYLKIPYIPLNTFTLSYFFKTTENPANSDGWYLGLGMVDAEVCGGGRDWGTSLMGSGQVGFGIGGTNSNTVRSKKSYNDGNWHFLTATKNDTTIKLYVDGVLESTGPGNNEVMDYPKSEFIGVGNNPCNISGNNRWFKGSIDDIRFYGRELTSDEINAVYKAID